MQPGDTIKPIASPPEPIRAAPAPVEPQIVAVVDQTPALPPTPEPPQVVEQPDNIPEEPELTPAPPMPVDSFGIEERTSTTQPLSWTASEFIEHQKPHGWYFMLVVGAILISGILYYFARDITTVVVVGITTVLFGIVGARKPRSMNYSISQNGVQIGDKGFPYATFKFFSLIEEGAIGSIQLMPIKRFATPLNMYFPPDQEQTIFDALATYLPHEEHNFDLVDRLMKRLHF